MRSNNNNTMKKVIPLLFFVSFAIMGRSADYTTFLTAQRGFTEVTSTSQILAGDYYYVIASAEDTGLIVTVGRYEGKPGWAPEETIALRYKNANTDPVIDAKNFFILEKQGSYIGMRSLPYSICCFQTDNDNPHVWVNAFYYEHNMSEWDQLAPSYQDGYWKFVNQKFANNSYHLGPWNKLVADGEAIAANRTDAVGDEAGHYRLFRISKADYETKIRAARKEELLNASSSSPMDATWMIKNPSFDQGFTGWNIYRGNPDTEATLENLYDDNGWKTNVGDNIVDWGDTKIADYGMTNKDGVYLFNTYAWWATNQNVNQILTDVPNGRYELSAVLCSHENRTVTLYGNDIQKSVTATGAGNGIPASLQVVVYDGTLHVKAGTTVDWWSDESIMPYTAERTIGFFKADNFQLKCLGVYLSAIAQQLPNDETTMLTANQWYYYDVPVSGKYILTGNLFGMVYTQECETPIAEVSENPAKGEMGFNGGRVFFKTKRSDATLKVEPATSIITFTAATLNVDGLPLTLSFPIVGDKDINPDGPGTTGTKLISSYVANKQIDVVAFQEDFNYDTELKSNMGGYSFGTHRSSITTDIIYTRPVDTDGLQFATRSAVAGFSNEGITQFTNSYSEDEINLTQFKANIKDGNSLIKKGYRYYEVTVGGEKIDVYITHDDAGTTDQSSTDPFVVSRGKQLKQIAEAIIAKGNTDRPKIFMGDTNCRWTREDIKTNFFDILSGNYDVSDTWVELYHNNEYPLPGQSTINEEVVDKIIYINPKGNNVMKLTPISYERDATNYVNGSGNPLSDHAPVIVKFGLGLYEEVDNTLILGDVNKDGQISIADVTALVNIILGKDSTSPYIYDHVAADVNQDGSISIADVTALVNIILGKEG